jgi:hypothetical protein
VAWWSGPCGRAPTATVEADGRVTAVTVDDPSVVPDRADVRLVVDGCQLAPYGVTPSPLRPGCPGVRLP